MSGLRGAERDALDRFARAHVRPSALARDEAARFDRGLWRRLADTGVFQSAPAGDVAAAARAFAGLAHGGLDVPLGLSAVAQWIGVHLIATFGGPGQQAPLDGLLAGEAIVAVCNAEPNAGTDLRAMRSRVDPDGDGHRAEIHKSSASNLSDADLALVSVRVHRDAGDPAIEVLVLPARAPLVQTSHVEALAGFRTGLTGALESPAPLPVRLADVRLGPEGAGPRVLRRCFHLERLLIGALIHGCIDGLLDECAAYLRAREADSPKFGEHQYVQDKLATIFTLARRTEGMVALALAAPDLEEVSDLLSAIKMTAVDDGLLAATTAYELHGYSGYLRAGFVQKLHRDLLAFKLLGGTRELMKIALFRDLRARWAREP